MSKRQQKRLPPFVSLPRHRRGDAVVCLKGQIRRDTREYGGHFTSHLVLSDPLGVERNIQWFEFRFPGTDRFTLWSAEIATARQAFWDAVSDTAFTRACAALEETDLARETLSLQLKRGTPRHARFGGRRLIEQVAHLEAAIAHNEPPAIHESFQLDSRHACGIGLRIVLDVERIDRSAIETAIARFRAMGESDWTSPTPVPRERLPTTTEHEALLEGSIQPGIPVR